MILLDQPCDYPAFAVTKIGLSELAEDLRNGKLRRLLDGIVRVHEVARKHASQPPAYGGLAHAHQPDERDRPIEPRAQCLDPGHLGRGMHGLHCSAA